MDLELRDKVAVVTGGSEGLGRAVALGLALEGARIAVSGRRQGPLDAAAETIKRETGAHVLTFKGDMTRTGDVRTFFRNIQDKWGAIHILVNNVGRATRGSLSLRRTNVISPPRSGPKPWEPSPWDGSGMNRNLQTWWCF